MGIEENAENMAEQTKGKVKEAVGATTDNPRLGSEGIEQQAKADAEKEAAAAKREAEELLATDAHHDRVR